MVNLHLTDDNLISSIVDWDNIWNSYRKTQKGKHYHRHDTRMFRVREANNLDRIRQSLIDGTYQPLEYTQFYVYEPKKRKIFAPAYTDKIVQHMLNNILRDVYEPRFIHDSYACIRNKGNINAVYRLQKFIRSSHNLYGKDAYLVKVDIRKFFYSIDREILKGILRRDITCQLTLQALTAIIDSSPDVSGLPLGNLTSQLFANILLNELDQYTKHDLKLKYYLRYADDIFIIVQGKERARETLHEITDKLEKLGLETHKKKSRIFPVERGFEGLGFRLHLKRTAIGKNQYRSYKNLRKRINKLTKCHMTMDEIRISIDGWYAHTKPCTHIYHYQ